MCGNLQEVTQKYKLGKVGDKVDKLVCDAFRTSYKRIKELEEQCRMMMTPCKCDPLESGEEYCNQGCVQTATIESLRKLLEKSVTEIIEGDLEKEIWNVIKKENNMSTNPYPCKDCGVPVYTGTVSEKMVEEQLCARCFEEKK
jgi:hypothetical protein